MNNKKCHKRLRASRIVRSIRPALAGLFAAIAACSLAPIAGSGTEEGNPAKVLGFVSDSLNRPVAGATVRMLPHDYNPVHSVPLPDSLSTLTDSNGSYRFSLSDTGHFTIYCIDRSNGTKALRSNVFIAPGDANIVHDTLLRPGSIKVVLSDSLDATNGYLYFPGTTIYSWLSAHNGYVLLDSVPGKVYLSIYYAVSNSAAAPRLIKDSVVAVPGGTTTVAYAEWKYSKKLVLTTTSSGADVANAVLNFPVLVRLTAGNFDFSRAKSDGGDIRFAKSNGAPLPYEIERWDAASQRAEIWVKVDTVRGNDSVQSLMMYWGASTGSAAKSMSNGAAVFDTASGFQGVWHLSETGSSTVKDATGNHYDGTPSDTAPAGDEGAAGPCRSFNGSSNCIRMNNTANSKLSFPENGSYAVSAWVYVDSLDNGYHVIAGKGNEQYFLKFKIFNPGIPNSPMVWEFVDYYDKTGYNITNSLPSIPQTRTWSYIVGVRKGTQQFLYLNGALTDSTPTLSSLAAPRNTADDVTIGKYLSLPADTTGGKCPFLGKIDEVRISNAANNADWIKLCYMNQKEPDALVKW